MINNLTSFFVFHNKEAKGDFKQILIESVDKIKQSANKLSNSIHTAKPYYEARLYAQQVDVVQLLLPITTPNLTLYYTQVVQGIPFSRSRS